MRKSDRPGIDLTGSDPFAALVVRTDFGDDAAWARIQESLATPYLPQLPVGNAFLVEDRAWAGARWEDVAFGLPEDAAPEVVFVADGVAMQEPHELLAVHAFRLLKPELAAMYFGADRGFTDHFRLSARQADYMALNLASGSQHFGDFAGPDQPVIHRA
ncbi:DUF6924 domain-containing protein [Kineosporia babensis]|uniref:DUF6924 domain-containing protein n=1 Tax=Kineosporia babensis TaxID=499548 RepID=A0A9X1NAQ4_9ACTN|nr:hypothetical protein [Kineosporia babensis]MCD5310336.1 hypothetical protein [Kineosporia babensis]